MAGLVPVTHVFLPFVRARHPEVVVGGRK